MVLFGGSSPQSRGTLKSAEIAKLHTRFIPAIAGNAWHQCPSTDRGTVHPRDRGERLVIVSIFARQFGSSPRSRGTHRGRTQAGLDTRFIPAIAGNAIPPPYWRKTRPVHPRDRGERMRCILAITALIGSSPRSRGTLVTSSRSNPFARFIPAIAGNATGEKYASGSTTVHPRDRGERTVPDLDAYIPTGSSPRSRGTRPVARSRRRSDRFIPAIAGNASRTSIRVRFSPVHPRDRGERCVCRTSLSRPRGSSPRSRGTPVATHVSRRLVRFIPAIAGNA